MNIVRRTMKRNLWLALFPASALAGPIYIAWSEVAAGFLSPATTALAQVLDRRRSG